MKLTNVLVAVVAITAMEMSAPVLAETGASKGIGPMTEIKLESLSESMAKQGKEVFNAKCSMCHKMEERYVGPALNDVFKRRTPEWIGNIILNPIEMTQKDPAAQELLAEYLTQMTFQNISNEQARQIIEYFRYYSEKGDLTEPKVEAKSKAKSKTK